MDAADRFARDVRLPLQLHWSRLLRRYLAVRTTFFDRCVVDAIGSGVRQVVVVGAGYDDRALRLRHADVRFIEVDEPVTQAHKRRRLEGLGLLGYADYVAVDLAHESIATALADHLVPGEPTFVMAEAVFPYVPEPGVRRTLSDLSGVIDRGTLAVDLATDPRTWQGRMALRAVKLGAGGGGEVIESVMDDATARRIVTETGWTIASDEDLADLGLPQLAGASLFVRAERR